MALLQVLRFPHPGLREKAVTVQHIDAAIRTLARDMLETMYAEGGVGLAATQVDVHRRVAVIDVSETRNAPLFLVNPEIIHAEGEKEGQEGCLSVPGVYDTVQRAEKVRYRYLDLDGRRVEGEAEGLMAVCLQHEIDHLDGRLFIDYLSTLKRQRIRRRIEKQEKHQALSL